MLPANQIALLFKMYYLMEEVNDELYYWHADKRQILLQVDNLMFSMRNQVPLK